MTAISTRATDSLLRAAIRVDAVVVAAVGVAMLVAAGRLHTVTGMPLAVEYVLGALSAAYGPLGFWLAARPRVRKTGLVLAEINVFSAIGLAALVATGVAAFGSTAGDLAIAMAVYTGAIGMVQYAGVRRAV